MIIPVKLRNFWKTACETAKFDPYLWLLLCLILLTGGLQLMHHYNPLVISPFHSIMRLAGRDVLFSVICLSSSVAALCLMPVDIKERLCLVGSCAICEIVYIQWRWEVYSFIGHAAYIGLLSMVFCLIIMLVYLIRFALLDKITAWVVVDVMAFTTAVPVLYAIYAAMSHDSLVYDLMLMKADGLWGFQPSFFFTRWLSSHVLAVTLMISVYFYMPLWIMGAQIVCYTRDHLDNFIPMMRAPGIPALTYLTVGVFGVIANHYLPAVGPAAFLGENIFPLGVCPDVSLFSLKAVYCSSDVPRSCIPCFNLAFVLCAYFSLYNLQSFWKEVWLILSILTAACAFSIGGHWAVDLLVTPPFVAFCLGLSWYRVPGKKRWLITAGAGLVFLTEIWLLKYHIIFCTCHPVLYWLGAITAVVLSFVGIRYMLEVSRQREYTLVQTRQPYRFGQVPKNEREDEEE